MFRYPGVCHTGMCVLLRVHIYMSIYIQDNLGRRSGSSWMPCTSEAEALGLEVLNICVLRKNAKNAVDLKKELML